MTQREEFEKWMVNVAKIIVGSTHPYPARLERDYWKVWQAAYRAGQAASFSLPDRMDYELHGDTVIDSHHNTFADGYNQCLSDAIAMNEEYANSVVSDGWIPVSERMPDDYSMSICVGHGGYQFICRKEPNGWFRFPQMKKLDGVTHWMPLPAAPEQPE
ncbi:DUF551 domain-containing protein [Tolumonas lignilytica]|uniref:DUF551 domain-containing protein n=1 Tax=Tolumonas lignilytica TaxID=1283284 RepID=UPI000467B455|nr:DUF551 domain-containing protein [Tolumonas lignilytica]